MKSEPFIVVRDDGYSPYGGPDCPTPITPEQFLALNVDYLADYPDVKVKEMGCGTGAVFTYNTKIGEIPMENASEKTVRLCREYDRRVNANVRSLASYGTDTITLAAKRCHEMGIKLWVRFELQHAYDPVSEDNYNWMALSGKFAREHPELRIGYDPITAPEAKSAKFEFSHPEVRAYLLSLFTEIAKYDIDGLSLDFCVWPPFFEEPEKHPHVMTEFMREIRAMLDREGEEKGRHIDLIARVDYHPEKEGVFWREWVTEGLIDYIIPSVYLLQDCWDVPNEEFVEFCRGTKCKVLTCIRPFMNNVTTDEDPEDRKSGITRDEPELTPEILYAKAMAGLSAGTDGVQIAIACGLTDTRKIDPNSDRRRDGWRPVYGKLGDMEFLKKQDKYYVFNESQGLPATLTEDKPRIDLTMRIPDDSKLIDTATLVLFTRGLSPSETVELYINGNKMMLTEKELYLSVYESPLFTFREIPQYLLFRIPEYWNIGRTEINIPTKYLISGTNTFTFIYKTEKGIKPVDENFRFGRAAVDIKLKR